MALIPNVLRVLFCLIIFCSLLNPATAQSCSDWLHLTTTPSYARTGKIDISGTKLTVESRFISTKAFTGGQAGDLVSKHKDPGDINYLLRPNGAEITTANGHFKTPGICDIELNKIYHVAMVYDGSSLKFYRNGFLLSEVAATGNLVQNNWNTYIGFYEPGINPENYIGYIDEVRIWNYARPPELIKTFMNKTLPVPTGQVGLVAYYTFEDLLNKQGNSIYDLTLSPSGSDVNVSTSDCSYTADSCGVFIPPGDSVIITNNVTICAGSHHQIKTEPADSYKWTPALYLDDPTSPVPVASPPVSMTFYVEAYRATTNTILHDSVYIRVVRSDIKANEDTTVCAGSPVQMNVTQGTSFVWSPEAGLSNPHIPNPIATPLSTTRYVVTGIGDSRCASSDTVLISVLPQPTVNVSNDTVICKSSPVHLASSGGISYVWSPSSGLNSATIPDPVATAASTTLYKVKVTGTNGCSITDSVKVEVRLYPDFKTSGNQSVCEGEQISLSASGGTSYQWSPATQVSDPFAATTIASNVGPSSTFNVYISENVCNYDTTIAMTVRVNPKPIVSAVKSNDINCEIPTAQLFADGADRYTWTPAVSLDNPEVANPLAITDNTTVFNVTGFTKAGCSSTASVTVNVDRGGVPRFVVPNAFSPNDDGKNDCFGIRRWGNSVIRQFSIYNRWGQLVFQTNNPAICWDGKMNGVLQAAGGYIYVIDATTLCGPVQRRGQLTLIR